MEIEQVYNPVSPSQDENRIEHLLSEKLLEGFGLSDKCCPTCATPLVKGAAPENDVADVSILDQEPIKQPLMVPYSAFQQPFKPVDGVPLCVSCNSHVVTLKGEASALEKGNTLKTKGSVFAAVHKTSKVLQGFSPKGEVDGGDDLRSSRDADAFCSASSSSRDKTVPSPEPQEEVIDVTDMTTSNEVNVVIDAEKTFKPVVAEEPVPVSKDIPAVEMRDTHADEKKEDDIAPSGVHAATDNADEIMAEYSVRRQIATKVLGAKMLQGYTLKETQCEKCGMPLMDYKGNMDCVVCPALMKKAKKKMKAQKKLAEETARLEREVAMAKTKRMETEALLRREREDRMQREIDTESVRLAEILQQEKARSEALEAQEALARAEEETLIRQARAEQEKKADLYEAYKATEKKRSVEDQKLLEETRRLAEMEERRKLAVAPPTESMKKDLLAQEHRKRLGEKAKLDDEITRLEKERLADELETRKAMEEKRAEEEAKMIATLEEEAARKAKAAESAIRKAKAALETVHTARRDVIAQTIAVAENEVVAEAEGIIKQGAENYRAPVILPTPSQLISENWETLRTEGRSVMTRRVMQGWRLLSDFCRGTECDNSPLITKNGKIECVVCGGCGNGKDGVYIAPAEDDEDMAASVGLEKLRETGVAPEVLASAGYVTSGPPINPQSCKDDEEDFDTKRDMVSKEIGKRMIQGWTLLDSSCPSCIMPLMMDPNGTPDICVLCGLITTIQKHDGSTVQKEEEQVAAASVPSPRAEFTIPAASEENKSALHVETLPSAPTFEDKGSGDLAESIRKQTNKREPMMSPMADPPSSTTAKTTKPTLGDSDDEITISLPKGFDFNDEEAVKDLMKAAAKNKEAAVFQGLKVETSMNKDPPDFDQIEVTNSGEIYTSEDAMSAEVISKMILRSPMGFATQIKGGVDRQAINDLVDIYVAANFNEEVGDKLKREVVDDIMIKVEPTEKRQDPVYVNRKANSTSPQADGVIHLEDVHSPEPKNFRFEMAEKATRQRISPEQVSPKKGSKKNPTGKRLPPRPDGGTRSIASERSRRVPRPTRRTSPRKGKVMVVGGPSDFSDARSVSELSRAESVASEALESILGRIETCKTNLVKDDMDLNSQLATADLIEKLAKAAVAMKQLEHIDT